jgi:23S rRNA (cytidine1920-2'-O)/16S rRNA (cytidine1409-2'-O)-methyltransferase
MSENRMRLDQALVERGLAPSRARARDAVKRGAVLVDGAKEQRPGRMVAADAPLEIDDPAGGYVSRAALKLVAALDAFGFDPKGATALDLGASTGGFTQVLLQRGATHVIAVDVGHGQFHPKLAGEPRITLLEGLNARDLREGHLGGRKIGAIVADLSFISLKLALPPALALAKPDAWGAFLVKPQFEVGRDALGKGGIVRDARVSEKAVEEFVEWLAAWHTAVPPPSQMGEGNHAEHGGGGGRRRALHRPPPPPSAVPLPRFAGEEPARWRVVGKIASPIAGGSGNKEFLIGARRA